MIKGGILGIANDQSIASRSTGARHEYRSDLLDLTNTDSVAQGGTLWKEVQKVANEAHTNNGWRDFKRGQWCNSIDLRDFITSNVTPYLGDEEFLEKPTARTEAVWAKLQPYFREEQKKGVLGVDAATPSTMLAHKPGYIDRDNEVIVGLQTDQPFKRAIFPFRRTADGRSRSQGRGHQG